MNRLAIFDCDGTLVDSQHNICLAMEECFAAAGLDPPARERTRKVVGLSLVEAMRALLPESEVEFHASLAEDYKRAFQAMRARGLAEEPLYEGVRELIDRLDAEAGCSVSPPASRIAASRCASSIMVSPGVSSPCRPPTAIPPNRIRRWSSRQWPMRAQRPRPA